MNIEGESLDRLYELVMYPSGGQDGDGDRIVGFIESIRDDTWLYRWHVQRDLAPPVMGSRQYVVALRDGFVLRVICDYSGEPGVIAVHVITLA